MSNFGGVNSNKSQQNYCVQEDNDDLLRYDDLELLVEQIQRETESAVEDFMQKHQFVLNYDKNLLSNEQNLMQWEEILKKFSCQFDAVDNEIVDHERELQQLENNVQAVEQEINAKADLCACIYPKEQELHWKYMEQLICGTCFNIEELNNTTAELVKQVSEYHLKKHAHIYLYKILDCHERILRQTEQNLDTLLNKLTTVQAELCAAWNLLENKT